MTLRVYVGVLLSTWLVSGAAPLRAQESPWWEDDWFVYDLPDDWPMRADDPEIPGEDKRCCEWEWDGDVKYCRIKSHGHLCP